jgi:hypothetical protein
VAGSGPIDLVFVMGWVSHLEYFWNEPSFARFLERLASMARLIIFDKRGTAFTDRRAVRIAGLPATCRVCGAAIPDPVSLISITN